MNYVKAVNVSGYSYYDKYWFNPSEEIARSLNGHVFHGYVVKSSVFPVSYGKVKTIFENTLNTVKPVLSIGLGLSPSSKEIAIKLAAVNNMYSTVPDVDGIKGYLEQIVPNGPVVVNSTLPLKKIIKSLQGKAHVTD